MSRISYPFIRTICHLLALAAISEQVKIIMTGTDGSIFGREECPDIAPGICCHTPRSYAANSGYHHVTFEGLTERDIAFIWAPVPRDGDYSWESYRHNDRNWRSYCSGRVKYSQAGPGTWRKHLLDGDDSNPTQQAVGASYM